MNNPIDEIRKNLNLFEYRTEIASSDESRRPIPIRTKSGQSISDDFYQNKFTSDSLIEWLNRDNG
jgi:hypothetical protein